MDKITELEILWDNNKRTCPPLPRELVYHVCKVWWEVGIDRGFVLPLEVAAILRGKDEHHEFLRNYGWGGSESARKMQQAVHEACLAGKPPKGLWAWCEFELRFLSLDK